jgi:hypothetical protein
MSTLQHNLQPHLLPHLRLALSVLYSLPISQSSIPNASVSSKDAHDYLMQFQSRNVRRKLKAQGQRQTDSQQTQQQQQNETLDAEDYGSAWLACLALISSLIGGGGGAGGSSSQQQPVHYAEALFAAQSMVHRLRKVKLCEAIDIEAEPPMLLPLGNAQPVAIYQTLGKWRETLMNGISFCDLPQPSSEDEDCIKGEISLLTVGELMYCLALRYHGEGLDHIRPLLSTLASAMAVMAARLRFTPQAVPHPAPNTQPVVTMIIQTLQHVHRSISAKTTTESPEKLMQVYSFVLYTCMTGIPDALLAGCGNGGRLSVDPRCYTALTSEVRTLGISLLCQSFADLPPPEGAFKIMFLHMCEEWARYVPLPFDFVESSIPMIETAFANAVGPHHPTQQQMQEAHAAMRYWIAIMEGGSWSMDQVLTASLIQISSASQQGGKKRQSSRSKKRQKEALENRTTSDHMTLAQNELQHRGEVACQTTMRTWETFRELLRRDLASVAENDDEVQGDGPVGGITACANACLPFLLRQSENSQEQIKLFQVIGEAVADVCCSPSRMIRGFASEPLYALQSTLVDICSTKTSLDKTMQELISTHFFQVSLRGIHKVYLPMILTCAIYRVV